MVSGKTRLKFHKRGKLKFLSHLDLVRTLKGALLRAEIPLYYTEGFNPHPKMVFSPSLPLGDESLCEFLDVRLTAEMEEEALLRRVNERLTPNLALEAAYAPSRDLREITAAGYTLRFRGISAEDLEAFLAGPLRLLKSTKKGPVEQNLRPNILQAAVTEEALPDGGSETVVRALLSAAEGSYLNPENLVKALRAVSGLPLDDYDVLRTGFFAGSPPEEFF